jgi:putative endonuclease
MARHYYVYILSSKAGTIYIGVTGNLARRVEEHRQKLVPGFTRRYDITKLVYYEVADNPLSAIEREKQLKGWRRSKKVTLVESVNPEWRDLAGDLL